MNQNCKSLVQRSLAILMTALLMTGGGVGALMAQTSTKKSAKSSSKSQTSAPAPTPIDVHSADANKLEQFAGIGPTRAGRIVAGRPYHSPEDLAKVKGMNQSKVNA